MDRNTPFTKGLKTPSPPAKIKLFLENFDDFVPKVSTSGGEKDSPIANEPANHPTANHPVYLPTYQSSEQKLNALNLASNQENQPIIHSNSKAQQLNKTGDSLHALKTEELNYPAGAFSRPLSSESQRSQHRISSAFRTRLGNTGDALTNIVKKYQNIQAQNKCSVVLDDSTDEEDEPSENTSGLSDTPSFKCSSDEEDQMQEEEQFSSSQQTHSIELSGGGKKLVNKHMRPYKSEPQLSSFEDSVSICFLMIANPIANLIAFSNHRKTNPRTALVACIKTRFDIIRRR